VPRNERERKQYGEIGARGHTVTQVQSRGEGSAHDREARRRRRSPGRIERAEQHRHGAQWRSLHPEGHGGQAPDAPPTTVARISRFTKDGKFIRSYRPVRFGSGRIPHAARHHDGRTWRLYVADRGNNRVQILDLEGRFIAEWKQFGRPSGSTSVTS
jgi:hypothetical protein